MVQRTLKEPLLRPHELRKLVHQCACDFAYFEIIGANLADRRDFRRCAGNKALFEAFHFFRHDCPFDNFDAALSGKVHCRAAGDAVEETIRCGGVQDSIFHKEDIGAGRFRNLTAIVEHQRVRKAFPFRLMLRQRTYHVEARRLTVARGRFRRRAAPFGDGQADAFFFRSRVEVTMAIPRSRSLGGSLFPAHLPPSFRTRARQPA